MRPRRIPERMCVGCREMRPKREMIRVVRSPEGAVFVDPTGKKSGRGAYVCPTSECLDAALKTGQLSRALAVAISEDVAEALRETVRSNNG